MADCTSLYPLAYYEYMNDSSGCTYTCSHESDVASPFDQRSKGCQGCATRALVRSCSVARGAQVVRGQ